MENVIAMILAGGQGRRMGVLCEGRPKSLLPITGKCQVIDFCLSNCVNSGITSIAGLVDHQRASMVDYLRRWYLTNGCPNSCQTLEPKSGSYKSTADAIYQNLDYLHKSACDTVLILPSDHVYKMDYRKMLSFHERVKADLTIGVISVPMDQAYRFGNITLAAGGRIAAYIEKPDSAMSNLVSMGIFLFNKQVLTERLAADSTNINGAYGFEHAIIPGMLSEGRVFAYEFHGLWQDIGSPKAYYEVNMMLTREQPSFSLDHTWPILTSVAVDLGNADAEQVEAPVSQDRNLITSR